MNGFDIALLVLVSVAVVAGGLKGLTRILVGLATLVAAFVMAARFHASLAGRLDRLAWTFELKQAASYLAIFLGLLLLGALAAFVLRHLVRASMLGWADRLAGAALGLVAGALLAALIILPLVAYLPFGSSVLRTSLLAPYVTVVSDVANVVCPAGLASRYRQRMDDLRRHWGVRAATSGESPRA